MTKSKSNTFGFWVIFLITLVMFFFVVSAISQTFLDFQITKLYMPTTKAKVFLIILPTIGLLLFGSQIWRDAKIILVDPLAKTIAFKNFFTTKSQVYDFDYFDGFVDTLQTSKNGTYRVTYLVKDKRYIKKVSSLYYSNYRDLRKAFMPLKYLGFKKYSITKSMKVLFGKQILD